MLDTKQKSERIKQARAEAGLTQQQMATALEMTASAVQKWESGGAFPRLKVLKKICEITGKPLEYFGDSATAIHSLVAWEPQTQYHSDIMQSILGRIEHAQRELAEAHHAVRALLGH